MINLSDGVQLVGADKDHGSAIKTSIVRAIAILEMEIGRPAPARDHQDFAFATMFRDGSLPPNAQYDREFIKRVFEVSQGETDSLKAGLDALVRYTTAAPPPATAISALRRGLKLLLVELWRQGVILLPTVFTPGPHFPIQRFEHPLLDWVRTFEPHDDSGSAHSRRMYYYGPRLLWASDWQKPQDVKIEEVAAMARARALHQRGESGSAIGGGTQLPLSQFLSGLHQAFPDETTFNGDDLARFSMWSLSHAIAKVPFDEYRTTTKEEREAARGPRGPRGPRERVYKPRKKPARSIFEQPESAEGSEPAHDVILRNFKKMKSHQRSEVDWQVRDELVYPGREHVNLKDTCRRWIESFRAYLRHRELVKGYRSKGDVVPALNLLSDYLFYYLPWWKEVASTPRVELPQSPRQFLRYAFVARHTDESRDQLPATLLELIRLRRPQSPSANVAVSQISSYFHFVETHFSDDEEIAGRAFKSPINSEFDAPRIDTKSKTNKEVIPKQIYGYLLFYCYALEEFGMHLEALAKGGKLPQNRKVLTSALRFDTQAFGLKPTLSYRGHGYSLSSVPNVFTWEERTLNSEDGGAPVFMPHSTALRLLIMSVETGLRAQSVQWLDRASWKRLGKDTPEGSYTFPLLINTDKTKTNSWRTFVVHRAWKMLERQDAFQRQFADADAFGPVPYEGTENSPFDSISPLFRAANSGLPISDAGYARTWQRIMVDFEEFYREASGERHVRMFKLQPVLDDDGAPVVSLKGTARERPFCPISILAIHTPHACRATFATNRKGVLELSDTAELLGHSSEVVTAHYDKPDEEDLRERLEASDALAISGFSYLGSDGQLVGVRADKPESALVQSFSQDRAATVSAFKFMPSIALWSTRDLNEGSDGLKLLQEGPMSRIRFRETHICPVGEECPAEVVEQIGEPRRCGSCPLAMKCIDHLPAIAAKTNQLVERIKYQQRRREQLEALGEPAAVLDQIWDATELDVNELLGWQLSQEVLEQSRLEAQDASEQMLHVQQPDVVRLHLQRVARSCNAMELILRRILDTSVHPSLSSPQVELAAKQIKRRLMAGHGLDPIDLEEPGIADVRSAAAMLAFMLKVEGLTMKDVTERLSHSGQPRTSLLTVEGK